MLQGGAGVDVAWDAGLTPPRGGRMPWNVSEVCGLGRKSGPVTETLSAIAPRFVNFAALVHKLSRMPFSRSGSPRTRSGTLHSFGGSRVTSLERPIIASTTQWTSFTISCTANNQRW
jgi:hypothetical protein